MKKLLALLLVLILVLSGCSVPEAVQEVAEPTATPTPTPVPIPSAKELTSGDLGSSMQIDFNVDGKVSLFDTEMEYAGNIFGTASGGTYAFDTLIKKADNGMSDDRNLPLMITVKGDDILVTVDGTGYSFSKTSPREDRIFYAYLKGFGDMVKSGALKCLEEGTVEKSATGYRLTSSVKLSDFFSSLGFEAYEESVLSCYSGYLYETIPEIMSVGEDGTEYDVRDEYIDNDTEALKTTLDASCDSLKNLSGRLTLTLNTDEDKNVKNLNVSLSGFVFESGMDEIPVRLEIDSLDGTVSLTEGTESVKNSPSDVLCFKDFIDSLRTKYTTPDGVE